MMLDHVEPGAPQTATVTDVFAPEDCQECGGSGEAPLFGFYGSGPGRKKRANKKWR